MKTLKLILMAGAMMAFIIACNTNPKKSDNTGTQNEIAGNTQYSCPMHPDVLSDQAGNCPKCGMKLEPVNNENADSTGMHVTDSM
jgi:hypothetical protein